MSLLGWKQKWRGPVPVGWPTRGGELASRCPVLGRTLTGRWRWVRHGCRCGHKGKRVGGVGLYRMGANGRLQPFDWWASYRSVIPNRVDRGMGALIIGGQHIRPLRSVDRKVGAASGDTVPLCVSAPVSGSIRKLDIPGTLRCPT